MFQTMTQIGKDYNIDAKEVGKALYRLKIRDAAHPIQKGFPFEQAITHGIAKAYEGRSGETYYRYNITPVKDEFEQLIKSAIIDRSQKKIPDTTRIESKLEQMLETLNQAIDTKETEGLYRLKADIADIYALLPKTVPFKDDAINR